MQIARDLPGELSERPEISVIVEAVAKEFGTDRVTITDRQNGRPQVNVPRQMVIYCSQKIGDQSLSVIAEYFSGSYAGSVSPSIHSIKEKL